MLQAARNLVRSIATKDCHTCGGTVGDAYVLDDVKVPGYTGVHEKPFCDEDCLEQWKQHVREWEEQNHEIPLTNTGPACGGC